MILHAEELKPYAVRHTGQIDLQPTTPAAVAFDVEEIAHSNYALAAGVVTVVESGIYLMAYGIPCQIDGSGGAARTACQSYVEINGAVAPMSYDRDYFREAAQGGGMTSTFLVDIPAGATVELFGDNLGPNTDISSVAGQSKLSMLKVG